MVGLPDGCLPWGKRTNVAGSTFPIRFHLMIETKPQVNLANQYMWEVRTIEPIIINETNTEGQIIGKKTVYKPGGLLRYVYSVNPEEYKTKDTYVETDVEGYILIGKPCLDWREELYRQALERAKDGVTQGLDQELLAEWRKLYNPMPQPSTTENEKEIDWYDESTKEAWNPAVFSNPGSLDYWLEFLDDGDDLRKYSVSAIGKRTKVVNKDTIHSIFNIQDIMFIENNFVSDDLMTSDE